MGQKISGSFSIQVTGAVNISENLAAIEVGATDNIEVEIDKGTTDAPAKKTVEVQPASDATKVKFLMITTKTMTYDGNVTYKVVDAGTKDVLLDGPLVLIGSGAVGLLGKSPMKIEFSNSADKAAIKILVGRVAS